MPITRNTARRSNRTRNGNLPSNFVENPDALLRPSNARVRARRETQRAAAAAVARAANAAAALLIRDSPAPVPAADLLLDNALLESSSEGRPEARNDTAVSKPQGKPKGKLERKPRGKPMHLMPRTKPPPAGPSTPPPRTPPGDHPPRILAMVTATEECMYNGQDKASLRVMVQVHSVYPYFRSCLGYQGYISLRRPGYGEDDFERNKMGVISGWRISKPTCHQPNIDDKIWVEEWLKDKPSETKYPNGNLTIANALRSIYHADGKVRGRVVKQEHRDGLSNDDKGTDLLYICTFYIRPYSQVDPNVSYKGNGYATQALDMYYRLLMGGILPAWYTIDGPLTIILEPGFIPDPEISAGWRETGPTGETEDELTLRVATTLVDFYRARGYTIYANISTATWPHIFNTMGRCIEPSEFVKHSTDEIAEAGSFLDLHPPTPQPPSSSWGPSPEAHSDPSRRSVRPKTGTPAGPPPSSPTPVRSPHGPQVMP